MRPVILGLAMLPLFATMACAPSGPAAEPVATTSSSSSNGRPPASTSVPSIIQPASGVSATLKPAVQPVGRQVISTANVALQVESVEVAVPAVRVIVENVGGYLEKLTSSGSGAAQQATMTVRVPPGEFFTALDGIQRLGTVESQDVGSLDVSDQFIDLNARLVGLQIEETRVLALVDKVEVMTDILALEAQLTRLRTQIEQIQGQLNLLQRRVDYGTINITLTGPETIASEAPYASMRVYVDDLAGVVGAIGEKVAQGGGMVTSTSLSVNQTRSEADMRLRVKRGEFRNVLFAVEGAGDLDEKKVNEGASTTPSEAVLAQTDATIAVTLVEKESSDWAEFLPGIILLVIVLGGAGGLAYWAGTRSGRSGSRPGGPTPAA